MPELPVDIPLDILEKVISHINLLDLNKLAATSKYVLNVIKSQINTFGLDRDLDSDEIITSFQMNGQYLFICRQRTDTLLLDKVQIIDIKTGIEIDCLDSPYTYSINTIPNNDYILSSNHEDKVNLWKYDTGQRKFINNFLFTNPEVNDSEITSQNISKDGTLIAIAIVMPNDTNQVVIYKVENNNNVQKNRFLVNNINFDIIYSIHFVQGLDNKKYLVCVGLDYIDLYDYDQIPDQIPDQIDDIVPNVTQNATKIYNTTDKSDEKLIRAIAVNDNYIAYCLFDYTVNIYDFAKKQKVISFRIDKFDYSRYRLFQYPFIITDDNMLIIGGNSITIRQGPNFKDIVQEIKIKSEYLAYNKETSIIATMCNGDRIVRFINLANISRMEKMHHG